MKSILAVFFFGSTIAQAAVQLDKIKLPPGFTISVFAKDIDGARSMTWGKNGTLFVGSRNSGKVYAVDPAGKVYVIAEKLNSPNGVAFRDGSLYVAEIQRLRRFDGIEERLTNPPESVVVTRFPTDSHHGWKFIAFGPDGKLYVPQGAPCNVCEVKDPYATIGTVDADGKNPKVIARGIRNSVGFDWHPVTKELWFTDNGRDMLGDDSPPDELNRITQDDMHFGFPMCHAGITIDPTFGKKSKCEDFTAPEQKLGPHVAALGMRFYTGNMFPQKYFHQIFIAEHGSWNRSTPLGYRITLVNLDEKGKAKNYEIFAEGWLQNGKSWGRPVDVLNAPDGSLLVSDDQAHVIYKISYQAK